MTEPTRPMGGGGAGSRAPWWFREGVLFIAGAVVVALLWPRSAPEAGEANELDPEVAEAVATLAMLVDDEEGEESPGERRRRERREAAEQEGEGRGAPAVAVVDEAVAPTEAVGASELSNDAGMEEPDEEALGDGGELSEPVVEPVVDAAAPMVAEVTVEGSADEISLVHRRTGARHTSPFGPIPEGEYTMSYRYGSTWLTHHENLRVGADGVGRIICDPAFGRCITRNP